MKIVRQPQSQPLAQPAGEWDPFRMMREMMRWDPFREMTPLFSSDLGKLSFVPDIDVKETAEAYVFKADVPGIQEKDLTISVTGNRLTISGKREEEKKEERENYYAMERSSGSFSRSFTLPEGANGEATKADMKDGVLTVSVPKKPEVKAKTIPVTASAPDKPATKA